VVDGSQQQMIADGVALAARGEPNGSPWGELRRQPGGLPDAQAAAIDVENVEVVVPLEVGLGRRRVVPQQSAEG